MATETVPAVPVTEPSTEKPTSAQPSTISEPSLVEPNDLPGTRKTPFATPSSTHTKIPSPAPLTPEQETKYASVLETVSSWPKAASSSDSKPDSNTDATPSTPSPLIPAEQIWLSRENLLRYLRASSWDVSVALKRLLATLSWRRSYGIYSKISSEYISIENETGKQWILGYDNAGRPCHYLNPSRQNTPRSDRQLEHLVFMLERCIDIMPAGQETLALLINFAETRSGQGASLAQGRQTLNILQNHYPERLGRALLCNLPWHISAFMRLIMPFVDPVTRQKVIFNEPMREHIPAEQLRVSHGGDLEFEYDHATYWPALARLAELRRKAMFERWVARGRKIGESEAWLKGEDDGLAVEGKENGHVTGNGSAGDAGVAEIQKPVVERDGEVFEDASENVVAK